ncbi:hypothetical protein HUU59_06635 [bacterium]|nr:hypothetical protein [bacterium]
MEASQLVAHAALSPVEVRLALHAACSVADLFDALLAFFDEQALSQA